MTDGNVMKGIIINPSQLQKQVLQQLQSNDMVIEKMRFLVHELVYWVSISADIENTTKQCAT